MYVGARQGTHGQRGGATGGAVINRARFGALEELAQFILSECCADTVRKVANDG